MHLILLLAESMNQPVLERNLLAIFGLNRKAMIDKWYMDLRKYDGIEGFGFVAKFRDHQWAIWKAAVKHRFI
jgi:hypothetical protein